MTERDMENLLWQYPEKFFNEPLKRFMQQPTTRVGRADLVFIDERGAFLVMELKRGRLKRKVMTQMLDYESHYALGYPNQTIRMMAVANEILPESQHGLKRLGYEWTEISEMTFVRVAQEVGYQVQLPPDLAEVVSDSRNFKNIREEPFARSREYAVGPCGNVAHLPPTPDRERQSNPFAPGSFLFEVFERARNGGMSEQQIEELAHKYGRGGLGFALENLSKGVRRNKGVRKLTGHYGLVWDVFTEGVGLPINGVLRSRGPSCVISVGNVRRAMEASAA